MQKQWKLNNSNKKQSKPNMSPLHLGDIKITHTKPHANNIILHFYLSSYELMNFLVSLLEGVNTKCPLSFNSFNIF